MKDPIARILFADTVTARVLRALAATPGGVSQAAFLADYHRRCARKNGGKSSLQCNFGRFLIGSDWGRGDGTRVISKSIRAASPRSALRSVMQRGYAKPVAWLEWSGPSPSALVASLSDSDLQRAYEAVEASYVESRATDLPGDLVEWLALLLAEVRRRADGVGRVAETANREQTT